MKPNRPIPCVGDAWHCSMGEGMSNDAGVVQIRTGDSMLDMHAHAFEHPDPF